MIINLKRILLYGAEKEINTFFKEAQKAGFLEFIPLKGTKPSSLPSDIEQLLLSLRILKKIPRQSVEKPLLDESMAISLAKQIVHTDATLQSLYEKRKQTEEKIREIAFFGNFSLEDIQFIEKDGKRKIQFFTMLSSRRKKDPLPTHLIWIGTFENVDYFISIQSKPFSFPFMEEVKITESLADLEGKLFLLNQGISHLENELKNFSSWIDHLEKALMESLNHFHLLSATDTLNQPIAEHHLFFTEAWFPENREDDLKKLLEPFVIDYVEVAEGDEKKPTCIENEDWKKMGEDLVKIYDVPAKEDKDPSSWVLISFVLFFSFIISDFGYGLLYLATALIFKWKTRKTLSKITIRLRKLVFLVATGSLVFGTMDGTFFGAHLIPYTNPLNRWIFFDSIATKKANFILHHKGKDYEEWVKSFPKIAEATNAREFVLATKKVTSGRIGYEALETFKDNFLLESSLILGVLHLSLSLLRNLRRRISGFGWVFFLLGGYLYFPKELDAISSVNYIFNIAPSLSQSIGMYLTIFGLGFSFISAVIVDKFKGLLEVSHTISIFADTLSYLRLYALALAGFILAQICNQFALAMPPYFGIPVLVIGHAFGFALGMMDGIIHSLRLNFIEWYHYSFEGDGRLFNPLKLLEK